MAVVIPSGIQDIRVRRALEGLARELGRTSDASIEVQEENPTDTTPGTEGDVIYATGSESIWVFTGTSWTQATSANAGIVVEVFPYEVNEAFRTSGNDQSLWTPGVDEIKNNNGTIGLAPRVYEGGVEWSTDQYGAATYNWKKSGSLAASYTPLNATQTPNVTGPTERRLVIDHADINDNGTDAFFCEVTFDDD